MNGGVLLRVWYSRRHKSWIWDHYRDLGEHLIGEVGGPLLRYRGVDDLALGDAWTLASEAARESLYRGLGWGVQRVVVAWQGPFEVGLELEMRELDLAGESIAWEDYAKIASP
jgi:hypothetical protein